MFSRNKDVKNPKKRLIDELFLLESFLPFRSTTLMSLPLTRIDTDKKWNARVIVGCQPLVWCEYSRDSVVQIRISLLRFGVFTRGEGRPSSHQSYRPVFLRTEILTSVKRLLFSRNPMTLKIGSWNIVKQSRKRLYLRKSK